MRPANIVVGKLRVLQADEVRLLGPLSPYDTYIMPLKHASPSLQYTGICSHFVISCWPDIALDHLCGTRSSDVSS